MTFQTEIEQEVDGRWLAEVVDLPGVMVYGAISQQAVVNVQDLALRLSADRLERGESKSHISEVFVVAA